MSVDYVVPHFNCSKLAIRAIDSLISQKTNLLKNIYIIDDCSDQDEIQVLEHQINKMKTNVELHLIKLDSNQGPGNARNKGIDLSSEEFIGFLDADDYLPNTHIEKSVAKLRSGYDFCYGAQKKFREMYYSVHDNNNTYSTITPRCKIASEQTLRFGNYIPMSTGVVRNNELPKFQNVYYDDYIFWIDMCLGGKRGTYSGSYCYYSVREGSLSYNKFNSLIKHFQSLKNSGHYHTLYACYLTIFYIINGLKKHAN